MASARARDGMGLASVQTLTMPKHLAAARALLAFALALSGPAPVLAAYCGCDKPPPAANVAVRPEFAYPGATIVLFSENFVEGRRYTINFYRFGVLSQLLFSGAKLDGTTTAVAIRARDQGDFNPLMPAAPLPLRPQLRVTLPTWLHYGPARIEVIDPLRWRAPVLVVSEDDFTVIGRPIVLTENMSNVDFPYQTGISRDGHVFFAFDMHNVRNPILIDARFIELILPMFAQGITGWNVQGFNVGTLAGIPDDPKFGWRLLDLKGNDVSLLGNASRLRYWRHEFFTWEAAHRPGGTKVLVDNPIDHDYWHQDGTPHFDHDHIVVAVDVSGLDPARLLQGLGVDLNLIRLRISTTVGPNPYSSDPNPTRDAVIH
jgi:hypothetical protein